MSKGVKILLIVLIAGGIIVYFVFRKRGEQLAYESVPKGPSGLQKAVAIASVAVATAGKAVAVVTDAVVLIGAKSAATGAAAGAAATAKISVATGVATVPGAGGGTTAVSGAASGIGATAVAVAAPLFLFSIPFIFPRLFGFRPESKAQYEARLAVWIAKGGTVISPGYVPLGVYRPKETET